MTYADLDMRASAGQRMLKRRLTNAIEEVCGSYANVREYSEEQHIASCRSGAWASADRQLATRQSMPQVALLRVR